MILKIDGNLGLAEQEDKSFKPYIFYRIFCTDQNDIKLNLMSVFQIKHDKVYKMVAKVNDFIDSDIFFIDSKIKKDFILKWLSVAEEYKGFYLTKEYYKNKGLIPAKKEEKFVNTSVDYFYGVKCAVNCIKLKYLFE
jgi:hypothetical protein